MAYEDIITIIAAALFVISALLIILLVKSKKTYGTLYFIKEKENGDPMLYVALNDRPKYYIHKKYIRFKTGIVNNLGDIPNEDESRRKHTH